jgi:hypothetical protein
MFIETKSVLRALSALLGCAATLAAGPITASAAETHIFDATLSLTGDCSVSTLDPTPDPGCPGGVHPPASFYRTGGTAVDPHGNRYVSSWGAAEDGSEGRVDVFGPTGLFLTQVEAPRVVSIAVDSHSNLYVFEFGAIGGKPSGIYLYKSTAAPGAAAPVYSEESKQVPSPDREDGGWFVTTMIAVNPVNDHLFVPDQVKLLEFGSAAEGNPYLAEIGQFDLNFNWAVSIDAAHGRIYASSAESTPTAAKMTVRIYDLNSKEFLGIIDGSTTSSGRFTSEYSYFSLATAESSGHLFVGDLGGSKKRIYEYDENGTLVAELERGFQGVANSLGVMPQIAIDDSSGSPTSGYLFVPSGSGAPGHSYAFAPVRAPVPPVVESVTVAGITEDEAVLRAEVDPGGQETQVQFQYTTREDFATNGFANAVTVRAGALPSVAEGIAVSVGLRNLVPGTAYRFRAVAVSSAGEDQREGEFRTYGRAELPGGCGNEELRTGPSALLPDCRAYELVTPSNTNGREPAGRGGLGNPVNPTPLVSPGGDRISFLMEGGPIPRFEGSGTFAGDPYLTVREGNGWRTEAAGPNGTEAPAMLPGSVSPDQEFSFWMAEGPGGPAAIEDRDTSYLRFPDGHSELLGAGSLGIDPSAAGMLITEGGEHVIFLTGAESNPAIRLHPSASPDGTQALYDRTPTGLHVVSLLPGDVTPGAGEHAQFQGASLDGKGVAFRIRALGQPAGPIYLRFDNSATFTAAPADAKFAGVAEGGKRLFYVRSGDLFAFDIGSDQPIRFTTSGDVIVANVSADGSAAYFVSPTALAVDANPMGALPQTGALNLYLTREGQISFVGTVTERDVNGVGGNVTHGGLGLWLRAMGGESASWGSFAINPSRSTPDGEVLLFESQAPLTDYDPQGHTQVYRYDFRRQTLRCLSCIPTGAVATGEANLQSIRMSVLDPEPLSPNNVVSNLRPDGDRAFFESTDQLVVGDVDGLRDVYEWEEEGVGICRRPGGCVYLISSGTSGRDDYLYAVSEAGDDVFFRTSDVLLPASDPDETGSIYDARVEGGFAGPTPPPGECLGEACQPVARVPSDPTPSSYTYLGRGNVKQAKCPKGKRAVRRRGKTRCVHRPLRPHRKNRHRRGSGTDRRSHR